MPTRTLVHGTVSLRSGVPGDESERFFPAGPGSSRRSVCRRWTNTRPVHTSILCVGSHPPSIACGGQRVICHGSRFIPSIVPVYMWSYINQHLLLLLLPHSLSSANSSVSSQVL